MAPSGGHCLWVGTTGIMSPPLPVLSTQASCWARWSFLSETSAYTFLSVESLRTIGPAVIIHSNKMWVSLSRKAQEEAGCPGPGDGASTFCSILIKGSQNQIEEKPWRHQGASPRSGFLNCGALIPMTPKVRDRCGCEICCLHPGSHITSPASPVPH
jgi:hypothetical protein